MSRLACNLAAAAAVALALAPIGARAQWYSSYPQQAPLYPYAMPRPYAVEVAPNTYVIHRPGASRPDPSVLCVQDCGERPRRRSRHYQAERPARAPTVHNDPLLIEELRKRSHVKRTVINTTQIVRDPPVVIEHKRVVDDPPRVIVRRHIDEEASPVRPRREAAVEPPLPEKRARGDEKRTIRAEAEVTILGPDRMTIRLFRKRRGGETDARAD